MASTSSSVFGIMDCECVSLARLAAAKAVLWNSMVPGVAPLPNPNKACVLGDGTGNMLPPPPGVRPDRMPDSFGVSPVLNEESNGCPEGPVNMAGDSGPDLSEPRPQLKVLPEPRFVFGEAICEAGGSKA